MINNDIEIRKRLAQDLQARLYSVDFSLREALAKPENSEVASFLSRKEVSLDDLSSVALALREYIQSLSDLPRLRAKVAVDGMNIQTISEWIKHNIMGGREFLLDVEIDPSLIGGIVLYLDGRVMDLSIKRRLLELFSRNKSAGKVDPIFERSERGKDYVSR